MFALSKKWNFKIYVVIAFFGAVVLLLAAFVPSLFGGAEITDENGVALSAGWIIAFGCLSVLVGASYLATVIQLLLQVMMHKNTAFSADDEGIHNAAIIVNLFAFMFVFRINFIPWSAVCFADMDDNAYIRVKTTNVDASVLGKLVLRILGYNFCSSMIKPALTEEELAAIAAHCKTEGMSLQ